MRRIAARPQRRIIVSRSGLLIPVIKQKKQIKPKRVQIMRHFGVTNK